MKKVFKIFVIILIFLVAFLALAYYWVYRNEQDLNDSKIEIIKEENPVINISDFVVIETYGYDGVGMAKANIDTSALYMKYADGIKYTGDNNSQEEKIGRGAFEYFCLNTHVDLTKDDKLGNGEEIGYKVIFDNKCEELLTCSFENTEGKYVVENLDDFSEFDPFENIEVSFSGISPCVSVSFADNNESFVRFKSSFDIDIESDTNGGWHNLKNGDVVTIKFVPKEGEFEKYTGYEVSTYEKQYVVENMPQYISSYEEMTDDEIRQLLSMACEINSGVLLRDSYSVPAMDYVGSIFAEIKDYSEERGFKNGFTVIYKVVRYIDEEPYEFYYPVHFTNVYRENKDIKYNFYLDGYTEINGKFYEGYIDFDECLDDINRKYNDKYVVTTQIEPLQ